MSIARTILGIIVASLATGPVLFALWLVADHTFQRKENFFSSDHPEAGFVVFLFASVVTLIGAVPAACINALVQNVSARKGISGAGFSALSGAMIGLVPGVMLGGFAPLLVLTGTCVSLLQWAIAVRPFRSRSTGT